MGIGYRLPSDIRADLEWYWCRADADLGVHSNMAATIMRANLLTHGKGPKSDEERPSGIRLALAHRGRDKLASIAARDEALRLHMLFGTPKLDHGALSDPMPQRAERARGRLIRIHASVTRLVRSPNGVEHERVLFWVYGDERSSLIVDELTRVIKYTKSKERAEKALVAASEAYAACHEAEMRERKRERRAKFQALLGAA